MNACSRHDEYTWFFRPRLADCCAIPPSTDYTSDDLRPAKLRLLQRSRRARFSVTPKAMKKSMKVTPKKTHGRPVTGRDPHVTSRMPPGLIAEVEAWATANGATRSETIRRLVELGLTIRSKCKQGSTARAERAKELASKTLDNLTAATPESGEKARRKGNLIKGPEEFRQVRVDRPKPKKG